MGFEAQWDWLARRLKRQQREAARGEPEPDLPAITRFLTLGRTADGARMTVYHCPACLRELDLDVRRLDAGAGAVGFGEPRLCPEHALLELRPLRLEGPGLN